MEKIIYDISHEPIVLSKPLLDLLLQQENPSDCIALYVFLYYTAKFQKTDAPKTNIEDISKNLKWSKEKTRKIKIILKELGIIEDIVQKDESGKIISHHVKVNILAENPPSGKTTLWENHPLGKPPSGKTTLWENHPLGKPECGKSLDFKPVSEQIQGGNDTSPIISPIIIDNNREENIKNIKEAENFEKNSDHKNKNKKKREDIGGNLRQKSQKTTQTLSEEEEKIKKIKTLFAKIYMKKYTQTTGLQYTEFPKLMKLTEKAARWLYQQFQQGNIKTLENMIYRALVILNFSFLRGKTDPVVIFGKVAEVYGELKAYSEKEEFFRKYVDKAVEEADKMEKEIVQLKEYKELMEV